MTLLLIILALSCIAATAIVASVVWHERAMHWRERFTDIGKQLARSDTALARVDHENQVLRQRVEQWKAYADRIANPAHPGQTRFTFTDLPESAAHGASRAAVDDLLPVSQDAAAGLVPPRRHEQGGSDTAGQPVPGVPASARQCAPSAAANADAAQLPTLGTVCPHGTYATGYRCLKCWPEDERHPNNESGGFTEALGYRAAPHATAVESPGRDVPAVRTPAAHDEIPY